jgi:tRNA (guanine37-N1)-methyltransferase
MSADGETFDQKMANKLSMKANMLVLCGHYKGIDERVRDRIVTKEISIVDYVLSGGELPALVLIDAVVRLIPGVLGDGASMLGDSFQEDLLDHPSYTRPAEFRGLRVPDVLLSGDHREVERWRKDQRVKRTTLRRKDLLK